MKTIYEDIKKQLQEQVPALRDVAMNTGQLNVPYTERSRPPVAYPCALLDMDITATHTLTRQTQECRASLTVTIATDRVNSIDDKKAMAPYDLVAEVYQALQGFYTEHFSPLTRTRAARVRQSSNTQLFIYEMRFSLDFIDNTAKNK